MNNNKIRNQIKDLGFLPSLGTSFYKSKRHFEYRVDINDDGSITFKGFTKFGSVPNYRLKFEGIEEFRSFADELLRFNKKGVTE